MRAWLELAEYLAAFAPYTAAIAGLVSSPLQRSTGYLVALLLSLASSYNIYIYGRSRGEALPPYWVFPGILAAALLLSLLPGGAGLDPSLVAPILLASILIAAQGPGVLVVDGKSLALLYTAIVFSIAVAALLLADGRPASLALFILIAPFIEYSVSLDRSPRLVERLTRYAMYFSFLSLTPPYISAADVIGPLALLYPAALLYLKYMASSADSSILLSVDYMARALLVLLVAQAVGISLLGGGAG